MAVGDRPNDALRKAIIRLRTPKGAQLASDFVASLNLVAPTVDAVPYANDVAYDLGNPANGLDALTGGRRRRRTKNRRKHSSKSSRKVRRRRRRSQKKMF